MNPAKHIEISPEIKTYLELLLQDANMFFVDESLRNDMIQELYMRLDKFIMAKIIENLPMERLEAFTQLLEQSKGKEDVENFILTYMPHSNEVVSSAFGEFRTLYLEGVTQAKDASQVNAPSVKQ